MTEEMLLSEFSKLPLEERAQIMVRNHFWNDNEKEEVKIKADDGGHIINAQPFLEAWAYAEKEKYVELVGGTPKSGPRYKVTSEGLQFMDKAL
jgi:hypothetical protein